MERETTNRRDFVRAAGAAAAAWTILKPGSVRGTPANSKVQLGLLGAGRRGTNIGTYFRGSDQVEMTALADIYDDQLSSAKEKLSLPDVQTYKSAKAILDADIDAIYIATPPYVHPEHFELAVESGKHILLEKPVAVDPAGIRRVLAAGRKVKPGQVVMVDFQQRYGRDYREAHQRVQDGAIGKIGLIRTAWIGGDLPRRSGHPESEEKVLNWLFYKERSGDIIVEQNVHNIDVAHWFAGVHPVAAMGYSHRAFRTDIGDIADTLSVSFKLPDGRVYSHSGAQLAARAANDVGEWFFGDKGAIHTSRQGYELFPADGQPIIVDTNYNLNQDVVDHFVKAVQGEVPAPNDTAWAAESTLVAIMARLSMEKGREVTFDEALNM